MDQRFDRKWAILHNTVTDRWHPIEFYACPLPSDPEFNTPRHYSLGHHTDGIASKEAAIMYIRVLCEQDGVSDCSDHVFAWDGSPLRGLCAYLIPKPKQEIACG
jgi:hypothetical protein